jgi:hypothetical protein
MQVMCNAAQCDHMLRRSYALMHLCDIFITLMLLRHTCMLRGYKVVIIMALCALCLLFSQR